VRQDDAGDALTADAAVSTVNEVTAKESSLHFAPDNGLA